MQHTKADPAPVGWRFWLLWVLASTVGWAMGWLAAFAANKVVVCWAVIGAMQWLVLRRRMSRAGWWVLASIAGWSLGLVVGVAVAGPLGGGVPGLAVLAAPWGLVVGAAQWLVLRKQVSRAGWWVLASIVGLAASWAASGVLDLSASRVVAVTIDGAIKGAVLGAITGIALVWLFRQPAPPKGIEDQEGIAWRKSFPRTIGYKL